MIISLDENNLFLLQIGEEIINLHGPIMKYSLLEYFQI